MKWSSWIFWIAGVLCLVNALALDGNMTSVMHQIYQGQMYTTATLLFIGGALCRGLDDVIIAIRQGVK